MQDAGAAVVANRDPAHGAARMECAAAKDITATVVTEPLEEIPDTSVLLHPTPTVT